MKEKFPTHIIIQDIGSGLNYKRKGFLAAFILGLLIFEALRRAGARPGDEVQIGDLVFEFQEDAAGSAGEPGDGR